MSDFQITLTTRDGRDISFTCSEGSDVIAAAEQASIKLPSACRDGACGACIGRCDSGRYTLGQVNRATLSGEAEAKGDVLMCRTYPQEDLHISAPYDYAHVYFGRQIVRQATISALEKIAERTVRLKMNLVEDEAGKAVEFDPGQFMELEIPDTDIRRAYSLANTGNWNGELEFLIRLQPEGRFSAYLENEAAIGQTLNVHGPDGAFGLQADSYAPAVFVAGGTGLAPFLSILRRMAEWGEDRGIHLLFGVNREDEVFCLDEIERLKGQLPGLTYTLCVWKPDEGWNEGFRGTPAQALESYLKDNPDDCDVYLCGPPALIDAATRVARERGIEEQSIHAEKFA